MAKDKRQTDKCDVDDALFVTTDKLATAIGIPASQIETMALRGEVAHLKAGEKLVFNYDQLAEELIAMAEGEAPLGPSYGLNGDSLDKLKMFAGVLRARQDHDDVVENTTLELLRQRGVRIEFQ